MDKKYELLEDQTIEVDGHTLYRIRALRDFGVIRAGDIGGFVGSEGNLSHYDACWIGDDALVCGRALVNGGAMVGGSALVYDDAWVHGDAQVSDNARVYSCAIVRDRAHVFGNAQVLGNALVYGNARVCGNAWIQCETDYLTLGPIGSRNDFTTFVQTEDHQIWVACGCFSGSLDDFVEQVKQVHGDSRHGQVYLLTADLARVQLGGKS